VIGHVTIRSAVGGFL